MLILFGKKTFTAFSLLFWFVSLGEPEQLKHMEVGSDFGDGEVDVTSYLSNLFIKKILLSGENVYWIYTFICEILL